MKTVKTALILSQISLICLFVIPVMLNGQGLGKIQSNTNLALPSSYNFKEYVFAEPNDQGVCTGKTNATAKIKGIFLSQTHRQNIYHPFFFTIGHRPALLQVAITGTGSSPDVIVEGIHNGNIIGNLCLKGPTNLPMDIDLDVPDFENYFSVTLPKSWIKHGLSLKITVDNVSSIITNDELKIGPYTEMNLVMVNQDVLDFNTKEHNWPIFSNFLQEMASAIPASTVRFGIFPEILTYPELIANNNTEQLARLNSRTAMNANGVNSEGSINSVAVLALGNLHRSTGDYLSTVYFGNTLNLAPGGWGGGKSFVGFDYTDIFIHELGHALSLPHWGEGSYNNPNQSDYDFLYPYGGTDMNGGGRGVSWNFIQDKYEFEDPFCRDSENPNFGEERSDCMQRNNACLGKRNNGFGPWDGYGDFSTLAIHRYLVGASVYKGKVLDGQQLRDFQFNMQRGFPTVSLDNDRRIYKRDTLQPQEYTFEEIFNLPGQEKLEQEVYLIYGSAHETQAKANIVYKPIKFKGTLPPVIDPTDSGMMAGLKGEAYLPYLYGTRDIVLKLTYEDGTVKHALNPFHSYARAPYTWGYHIWRDDVCNFSLVVPGDKKLSKVELYKRPFCIRYADDSTKGNINYLPHNITAANFMDSAVYQAVYEFGKYQALGSNTIGNRVWHDLNQNGIDDNGEKGIEGVSLVLWRDSDGDNIPDWMGFSGVAVTDENGYYSFTGLTPGNYSVFVWSVNNWESGEPLHGMVPTKIYEPNSNTDIDRDNNGFGSAGQDLFAGMISLADNEPLNDGDRQDDWFDYDRTGNMTVDFGFYVKGAVVSSSEDVEAEAVVSIYPNPFSNYIRIDMQDFEGHKFVLRDALGRDILTSNITNSMTEINTDHLVSGVYLALIRNSNGKIVKTHTLISVK